MPDYVRHFCKQCRKMRLHIVLRRWTEVRDCDDWHMIYVECGFCKFRETTELAQ